MGVRYSSIHRPEKKGGGGRVQRSLNLNGGEVRSINYMQTRAINPGGGTSEASLIHFF